LMDKLAKEFVEKYFKNNKEGKKWILKT
jgi:hypothetical protein